MTPMSITQTSVVETLDTEKKRVEDAVEYELRNRTSLAKSNPAHKPDVYDEVLKTMRGDPKILAPLRKWEKRLGFHTPLRWVNSVVIIFIQIVTIVWFMYEILINGPPMYQTIIFGWITGWIAGFGVTAGAHRYWCHRSYKAKLPLQIILALCYSAAGQNTIFEWVRDHRVHHKFSETSADPHDSNRGFFFSHMGWLMMKKHPDVIREGKKIDMSDIVNDPFIRLYTKYFLLSKIAICWVLPSIVPALLWGESWTYAVLSQALMRYVMSLHFTWSVNSFAHMYGNKPYDRYISPVENRFVSIVALGEGWHNYHHTFPWDYKASELGVAINTTTFVLDLFARIGWAYDLKEASPSLVSSVAKNRGDPRCSHS